MLRLLLMAFLSELARMVPCIISWLTLDAAASSWESAVDMVLARIPAKTRPAPIAITAPCSAMVLAIWMIIVSVLASVRFFTRPAPVMVLPTIPMAIAINIAMTTQTEATRRDMASLFSSSMAIKRSRI